MLHYFARQSKEQIDVCREFCQHFKTILYAEYPKPFKTSIPIPDTKCCELKPGQSFRTQLTLSVLSTSQKLTSNSAERELLPCHRMSQFLFNRQSILIYKPDLLRHRCSGNDSGFPWYTFSTTLHATFLQFQNNLDSLTACSYGFFLTGNWQKNKYKQSIIQADFN